ncbi:MAG: hypothetical protein JWR05_3498 [Mucilaginibacter sp.]|nr:hypothetical protein [Mucilaginibacter sp.]
METLALKPQHETTVIGQLLSLKSQLVYHAKNTAPFYNEMAIWEMKEYKAVNEDNEVEFLRLKNILISNQSTFNVLLSEYGHSVAVFVNKYLL